MDLNGINIPELNEIEKCYCLEELNTSESRIVKVYMPKLMALNDDLELEKRDYYLDTNLILNQRDSLPQELKSYITLKNYIEVPLSKNAYIDTIIKKDEELTLLCKNKDIQDLLIIEL